ncbi:MAG: SRPBCC family protein [Gemmataceae bacterium]
MNERTVPTEDHEIVTMRVLNVPREKVYRAWTEAEQIKQWWGPLGFTNTFHEFDPKPGGQWKFIMHGPNGVDYQNHNVFVELNAPERIVLDHVSKPEFRVTATFDRDGDQTKVTFRMTFQSAATCEQLRAIVVPANEENFDRMEAVLAKMT